MRVAKNPLLNSGEFRRPERVTVAMTTYIPVLSGYWEQGLDALKLCIASLLAHTREPFDLMVLDNGSCPEVRSYLQQLQASGSLQYLILNGTNIGLAAARNFLFGSAPGELVAYTDSDVYFYPGWLQAEMEVLNTFPNVGMVSGVPTLQNFGNFTNSTIRVAEDSPEILVERGRFISEEWSLRYADSVGKIPEKFLERHAHVEHVRLTYKGVKAYATATHFQFLARTSTLRKLLPFPVMVAIGKEAGFDQTLDEHDYMRLSVDGMYVYHLGNRLTDEWVREASKLGLGISLNTARVGRRRLLQRLVGPRGRRYARNFIIYVRKQSFKILNS